MAFRKSVLLLGTILGAGMATQAQAQSSPSPYTTFYRYDADRRLVGTIAPDPDESGPRGYAAVRNTYDGAGRLVRVEKGELSAWQSEAVAPANWSGFAVLQVVDTSYDALDRKGSESLSAGGTVYTYAQTKYDLAGRVDCTAVRMNPAAFGATADACALGPQGSFGPDRITRNSYDDAGELLKVTEAYGTADQADERSHTYTGNGKVATLTDAENNKTTFVYDGQDRLAQVQFPSPAKGAGTSNANDYEAYTWDQNGNRTSVRNRGNETLFFSYDALNRMTLKDRPGSEPDVTYEYDLRGLQTSAQFPSTQEAVRNEYDNAGRLTSSRSTMGGALWGAWSQYDADGNRVQLTYPDNFYVTYDRDKLGRVTAIRENGAWSGVGVLASYVYDALGRRSSLTRGNGTVTRYGYDGASRLTSLALDLAGTANDQNVTLSYNPASQIVGRTGSNDAYAWTGHGSGSTGYAPNGLNQLVGIGSGSATYDAKGNMTYDPTLPGSYSYSSENLLTGAVGPITGGNQGFLKYDPLMRLAESGVFASTKVAYDGDTRIAEYSGSNDPRARYVFGPNVDEPLVSYEGSLGALSTFVTELRSLARGGAPAGSGPPAL